MTPSLTDAVDTPLRSASFDADCVVRARSETKLSGISGLA